MCLVHGNASKYTKAWDHLHHYCSIILTYSMVQSPSWEANWFAASKEIPHISWNPKVHYRTNKRPPPVSILGQSNTVFSNHQNKCSVGHNAHRFIQWKFVLVAKFPTSSPRVGPCVGIPDVFHVYQHLSYNPLTKFANSALLLQSELSSICVV